MSEVFCKQCGVTDDQQANCDDGCGRMLYTLRKVTLPSPAKSDCEEEPTRDERLITTPPRLPCSVCTDCTVRAIRPHAPSLLPTEKDLVAAE